VCGGKSEITYLNQPERSSETFSLDPVNWAAASESMRILANTDLKIVTQAYSLPKTLTFLEMFGAGRLEHLNPLKRWRDNNPVKSLAAPIGIATDGSTFYLDLHQKFQGPHGLVAGMTGSGKSEFLLTYILSMAVNFHPDEVAFVLIDYKGGGLAGAFDDPAHGVHLPHLIGTITNLDGSTIQRSIMSIQSELLRRQRIFNEVKNITDEGTMDIYKYQRLYRNGAVSEPIPHLFIISDEFAELKQQQPEFMDNLISIARIGRSLGVHLILATQKPSGVVNDQIRSNTKFRVCLKVQDKSDSIDMLQRPEAAELKDTGRFYLQVGYNELFALGQSAWSGADYYPEDEVVVQLDDSVQFIDAVGSGLLEAKPKTTRGASCGTQLVSAVKMLSDIAEENGIKCRPLWQPALPKKIELEKISTEKYNKQNAVVCADLGLLDDPSNQKQFTLNFDFSHCRNLLIVGDQGSGKTTLIQSILYSLTSDYSPEELNYYILDYSSRMFKVFSNLPHCGGVFFEEDTSRLESLFKLISSIVTERKRLFTALEVDSFDAACAVQKLPLILVVIDNYSAFASTKLGEALSGMLYTCVKNYTNYGIKFVVSCNRLNEMPMRTKQEFVDRICLHVKDKYDFGDVLGCKVQYVPGETPGRGLYEYEGLPLEFQAAMFKPEEDSARRIKLLKMFADNIANAYVGSSSALRLPTLSETQTYEEFSQQFDEARFPLGYSLKDAKPVALPFRQFSSMSLYFGNPAGIS
ncbi:MAG: type VII secretion protein EssC, partial [Oscillospiraceae bacterium]|nr:type VII secretion protein EssC [Oscillospiraceae bacterium]